jgi:hypothetical protein
MSALPKDRRSRGLMGRSRGSLGRGKADDGQGAGGASVGVVEGGVDVEGVAGRRRAATRAQAVRGDGEGRSHDESWRRVPLELSSPMTSRPSPPCSSRESSRRRNAPQ